MTDPGTNKTYIEPLTPEIVSQIISRKPDAILPTMGVKPL